MSRSPLRTRPSGDDHDESEKMGESPLKPSSLSKRLVAPISPLGRPYTDDEEKKQVFTDLIRLKSSGKSNKECAEILAVSPRTIDNYRADPYYTEIEQELLTFAHSQGYHVIGELIGDALATMYGIMVSGKSEFVRFKAAESLLNYAGYNTPRETAVQHSRVEAEKFLEEMRERRQISVNVQVNNTPGPEGTRVSVVESGKSVPVELQQYYQPVENGGRLPAAFSRQLPKEEEDTTKPDPLSSL